MRRRGRRPARRTRTRAGPCDSPSAGGARGPPYLGAGEKKSAPKGRRERIPARGDAVLKVVVEAYRHEPSHRAILLERGVVRIEHAAGAISHDVYRWYLVEEIRRRGVDLESGADLITCVQVGLEEVPDGAE